MRNPTPMLTVEAAITDDSVHSYLADRAEEYQRLLRQLYVGVNARGQDPHLAVKQVHRTTGWSTRQLNAVRIELDAMFRAWKEGLQLRILAAEKRIQHLEDVIASETDKNNRHQRQRKLARWKSKLAQMQTEIAAGRPRICFGGLKLFRAQFHLKENGYSSHEEWLQDWRQARSSSFSSVGRADEVTGNQECRLTVMQVSKQELTTVIRLRKLNRELPKSKVSGQPHDYVTIPVVFRYNIPQILTAGAENKPLTYRFFHREGKWRVHLIFKLPEVTRVTDRKHGALGIDQNPECIACAQIKPDGNLERLITFDLRQDQPTADQTRNALGEIVARLVTWAATTQVPIVIERLDFPQLQKELKSRGLNRHLSRFKYGLFQTMLYTRAAKAGIEVITVNPAYTSLIGYFKFGYGNGLNRHESAAVAIARRLTRSGDKHFSERIRFRTQCPEAPDPKTLRPPATDGRRHPWKGWKRLGSLLAKSPPNGPIRSSACPAGGGSNNKRPAGSIPQIDW